MSATTASTAAAARRRSDWRLRLSLAFTIGWLVLGALYISGVVGWTDFVRQRAPELGGFLEGAFAPLAFLWLVVGFFLQQQQLEENTRTIEAQLEVMRQTAAQAEIQTRAIAADELHSRQDTFLRTAELVYDQLGVITGFIVISWAAEHPERMQDPDGPLALWSDHGSGDDAAFARYCFSMVYSGQVEARELFHGTERRAGHTASFVRSYERLLRQAEGCDRDGIMADAITQGTHGRIHRMMKESA